MNQRAYSTIDCKAFEDASGKRTFKGTASTPAVDRTQDILVSTGATFKLPIPLLWAHDSTQPIGWITSAKVTAKGIDVECEVANVTEPGRLKDRLDEAWQSLKALLVRGLSVGFRPIDVEQIEGSWGRLYKAWEILEVSAVVVPCNADCNIQTVKSIDTATRTALGIHPIQSDDKTQRAATGQPRSPVVRLGSSPGASGITKTQPASRGLFVALPKGNDIMKSTAERIADYQANRVESMAKIKAILDKSNETGETFDAEQTSQLDELRTNVATVDKQITTLREIEAMMLASATVVTPENTTPTGRGAVALGAGGVLAVKSNLPKGIGFARMAMTLVHAKGNLGQAADIAKRWKDAPELSQVMNAMAHAGTTNLKAAVAVGDSNTNGWASQLVFYDNLASEFYGLLYPKTIIGRIPGLRRIPFNVRIGGTSGGSSSAWVGENNPIPASAMAFTSVTLGHAKAASLVVFTRELATMSNPQAEMVVRDDMLSSMTKFADQQFIDPAVAASANVSPASITNGAVSIQSTGNTVAAIYADVALLKKLFIAANLDMAGCVWVMKPGTALDLSMKRTTQDITIFPEINMDGGTWFGLPVVTSNSVPGSVSGGSIIALVKADEVFFADDGGITMDYTQEASVQMLTNPATGAQSLVSLFQNDLVGLRAIREMNWQRRRPEAVAFLDGVNYSA